MDERAIRAVFDNETITIYQAYRSEIAIPAVRNQKFVYPFKMNRMTWIKPSFLWMMYRSGWGQKEGQEHILAIQIKREGWEWALKNACLTHFDKNIYSSQEEWKESLINSPVRVQWDPEKDIFLNNLDYRSIQVGLSGGAVEKYVNEWTVNIEDISNKCKNIRSLLLNDKVVDAAMLLPHENTYPLSEDIITFI